MKMKIEVNGTPKMLETSQATLLKMKEIEARHAGDMTTVRIDRHTVVSCKNKNKIEEYKKSLNIK